MCYCHVSLSCAIVMCHCHVSLSCVVVMPACAVLQESGHGQQVCHQLGGPAAEKASLQQRRFQGNGTGGV